jgi:hypothetical protein
VKGDPVRNTRGKAAVDDDFFGREAEVIELLETLRGDNVLLLAPRRVGKTSLMHALAKRWRAEEGNAAFFVDVQGAGSELQFVRKVASVLDKAAVEGVIASARRGLARVLQTVGKVGGTAGPVGLELELRSAKEDDWLAVADVLVRTLGEAPTETLLLVDELPLVVQQILTSDDEGGPERAKAFLDALRGWRIDPALSRIHWLVAGSIGLDTLARRHGFSASINDFVLAPLGAFDDRTARQLVDALVAGHRTPFDSDARDHLVRRLGGWSLPYYVQILFGEARALSMGKRVDIGTVDRAWETLLDANHRSHFDHWWSRLGDSLAAPDAERAHLLLHAVAASTDGLSVDEARVRTMGASLANTQRDRWAFVVDTLTSDGYIVEQDGRLRFRSPLLREFWVERVR